MDDDAVMGPREKWRAGAQRMSNGRSGRSWIQEGEVKDSVKLRRLADGGLRRLLAGSFFDGWLVVG